MSDNIYVGSRVIVPLGKSKIYTGIVRKIHSNENGGKNIKNILFCPDSSPIINIEDIEIWEWMTFYYHSSPGDVYKAVIPSYFRNFDDIWVTIPNPEIIPAKSSFLSDQLNTRKEFQLKNIIQSFGLKNVSSALLEISKIQTITADYRSTLQIHHSVIIANTSNDKIKQYIENSGHAPSRKRVLEYFLTNTDLLKSKLKETLNVGTAVLKPLIADKILRIEEQLLNTEIIPDFSPLPELNESQQKAFKEIKSGFEQGKPCLLHGITSSGKTLIYLHLIKENFKQGKQVLYLLPEIALTTQIIERINESTSGLAEVYHSKFAGKSKLRLWEDIKTGKSKLIIGARSAIFLPFHNLGLIIVDEEHDQSFKQHDPAPRYNARDMAIMLGKKYDVPVILGSATPSAESWLNAIKGKYNLVKMYSRYMDFPLPQIKLLDTFQAKKRKIMDSDFHPETLAEIRNVLDRNGQVIILRNRKGYAPILRCTECGWTANCPNCSVNLTYHKKDQRLRCHHCHYSEPMPNHCPECNSTSLSYFGYGTQKVEEDLQFMYPDIGISRFDQDNLHSPKDFHRIMDDFKSQKTKILVGTQMLTKGLDFQNVRLIVVLNSDQMLNYPDFRAFERGFQMLEQVSGRTGRHMDDALVLIQTSFPDHPILKDVKAHDYVSMITNELKERKALSYPPYVHLLNIHIKSKDQFSLERNITYLYMELFREFGNMIDEPAIPVIEKKNNLFERIIQVRFPKNKDKNRNKHSLHKIVTGFSNSPIGRSFRIFIDADPV
jgi:primosomal protein N' (replication factor Y)